MRRLILPFLLFVILLASCSKTEPNVTFTAVIESVHEGGISVTTSDGAVDFDKASVGFDKSCEIGFNLIAGQAVELTILPEVRESYPVQVTAVSIKLIEDVAMVEYKKISGDEAAGMMTGDVIVLDVRTEDEFSEGHIQDAVLLPYDEIKGRAAEILPDKNATILVYCRTGRRSEIAAKELVTLGYTAVYDFGGITTDWNGEVVK